VRNTSPLGHGNLSRLMRAPALLSKLWSEPVGRGVLWGVCCGLLGCGSPSNIPDGGRCPVPVACQVTPSYPAHARWNSYVRLSEPAQPRHRQSVEVSCSGDEVGSYLSCIHGGELRQVELPGWSCSGLRATDALEVFEWICEPAPGGALFVTHGFREGKGLANLLTASGFRENAVTISQGSCVVATAEPKVWWDNPVKPAPDNPSTVLSLSESGTLYVVPASRASAGYNLGAEGVGLVTLAGATLRFSDAGVGCDYESGELDSGVGSRKCLVAAGHEKFLWLEGSYDGTGADLLLLRSARFARVNRLRSENHTGDNLLLVGGQAPCLTDVSVASGYTGLRLESVTRALVRNVHASHNIAGVVAFSGSQNQLFDVVVDNNDRGLELSYAEELIALGVLAANNNDDGIIALGCRAMTLGMVSAINNGGVGLQTGFEGDRLRLMTSVFEANRRGLSVASAAERPDAGNFFANVAALDNTENGIYVGSDSPRPPDPVRFDGVLLVGNVGNNCVIAPGAMVGGLDGACNHGPGLGTPAISVAEGWRSFLGRVLVDDAANAFDKGGLFTSGQATDWLSFENRFRAWADEPTPAVPYPAAMYEGKCNSALCRIWDWRLSRQDSVLRGRLGQFFLGVSCPASLDPSTPGAVMTDGRSPPNEFLTAARELEGDGDGLCEANEVCVFTPNLGAYQGEALLTEESCVMPPGRFSGTRVLGRVRNGG
jgi:hypothetical protein